MDTTPTPSPPLILLGPAVQDFWQGRSPRMRWLTNEHYSPASTHYMLTAADGCYDGCCCCRHRRCPVPRRGQEDQGG